MLLFNNIDFYLNKMFIIKYCASKKIIKIINKKSIKYLVIYFLRRRNNFDKIFENN